MYSLTALVAPAYRYQFVASLTATITIISEGMHLGWSSPMLPLLRTTSLKLTTSDETWIEVLYLLFGLVGLPILPFLNRKFGPRNSTLLACICGMVSWILLAITSNLDCLYIGRCLSGIAADFNFVCVPMYISEIADKKIRGFLNSLVCVMTFVGLVLVYAIVPFVPLYVSSIIGASLLLLQLMIFSIMPDSPYYLIAKGRQVDAMLALNKLRGVDDCSLELEEIVRDVQSMTTSFSISNIILKKTTLKPFFLVTLMHFFQHFTGLNAILMNLHTILTNANSLYLTSNASSILFAVCMLGAVIFILSLIDNFGRRPLLMISCTITGLTLLGIGVYFHLQSLGVDLKQFNLVPVVLVMFYAVGFSMGLEVVPKVMGPELFSTEIKVVAMSVTDSLYIIFGALSIFFYKYSVEYFSFHFVFYVFAGCAFVGLVFTFWALPETKGRSLQDIQTFFDT